MSNKDFCKWVDCRFKSEKHKQRGPFGGYNHLIRLGSDTMYFSSGDTEAQAWKAAKDEILSKAEHYFKLKHQNARLTEVCEQGAYGKTKVSVAIEVEGEGFDDDLVVVQKTETDIWQNALKAAFKKYQNGKTKTGTKAPNA